MPRAGALTRCTADSARPARAFGLCLLRVRLGGRGARLGRRDLLGRRSTPRRSAAASARRPWPARGGSRPRGCRPRLHSPATWRNPPPHAARRPRRRRIELLLGHFVLGEQAAEPIDVSRGFHRVRIRLARLGLGRHQPRPRGGQFLLGRIDAAARLLDAIPVPCDVARRPSSTSSARCFARRGPSPPHPRARPALCRPRPDSRADRVRRARRRRRPPGCRPRALPGWCPPTRAAIGVTCASTCASSVDSSTGESVHSQTADGGDEHEDDAPPILKPKLDCMQRGCRAELLGLIGH